MAISIQSGAMPVSKRAVGRMSEASRECLEACQKLKAGQWFRWDGAPRAYGPTITRARKLGCRVRAYREAESGAVIVRHAEEAAGSEVIVGSTAHGAEAHPNPSQREGLAPLGNVALAALGVICGAKTGVTHGQLCSGMQRNNVPRAAIDELVRRKYITEGQQPGGWKCVATELGIEALRRAAR